MAIKNIIDVSLRTAVRKLKERMSPILETEIIGQYAT